MHLFWKPGFFFQSQQAGSIPCGSTGTSSGNYQEMETCMVGACNMPWQPLQNHPLKTPGGWAMPWLAEKMMDGQHQRVDIPTHVRTAHKGLLQKKKEKKKTGKEFLLDHPSCPPDNPIGQRTELNWTESPNNWGLKYIYCNEKLQLGLLKNIFSDSDMCSLIVFVFWKIQ